MFLIIDAVLDLRRLRRPVVLKDVRIEFAGIANPTSVLQEADIAGLTGAVASVNDRHVVLSKVKGSAGCERVDTFYVTDSA